MKGAEIAKKIQRDKVGKEGKLAKGYGEDEAPFYVEGGGVFVSGMHSAEIDPDALHVWHGSHSFPSKCYGTLTFWQRSLILNRRSWDALSARLDNMTVTQT